MGLTVVKGNMIEDGTITDTNFTNTTITSTDMALDPRDADNLTSGDVPLAQLGNVPAVDLTGLDDDLALLGFKTQANGSLAKYNLLDQTVDSFEDASGVDASGSTDEVRDSSGKYYSGTVPGNYFGNGELGTVTFGASSITQTGDTVAIDSVLSTGSESGGPGASSYGTPPIGFSTAGQTHGTGGIPNVAAMYELTTLNGTASITSNSGSTDGSAINADADMVVAQFDTLTIDASVTLSTNRPCRGLFIYVKNNCTINGALSMTGRGAKADPTISGGSDTNAVGASGLQLGLLTSGGGTSFTNDGTGFNGSGTAVRTALANQANIASNGTVFTIGRAGAAGSVSYTESGWTNTGTEAADGTTGGITLTTGGGASASCQRAYSGTSTTAAGGAGTCFSGGPGSGNVPDNSGSSTGGAVGANGGVGGASNANTQWVRGAGGAGNPGGGGWPGGPPPGAGTPGSAGYDGTGGLVWLVVGGDLNIGAAGTVEATGTPGVGVDDDPGLAAQTYAGSGGSGGGACMVLYNGTLTNNGAIKATGSQQNQHSGYVNNAYLPGDGGVYNAQVSAGDVLNNMILVSNATAAQAAPTKGDIVFTYTNGAGTAVINTNITAEVSADDGSTWTTFSTLASQGTTGGHTIVSAHDQTISSTITSPWNMRYRIKTLVQNASMITRIQAVSLGWS